MCGRQRRQGGPLSRTGGRATIFFSLFLSLPLSFSLCLALVSSSLPLSLPIPGPFRAEGGTARNEAARAVAAPRGGVAVDLCSSTSASTMSRSGREADAGLFSSSREQRRQGRASDEANCWPREERKTEVSLILPSPLVPSNPHAPITGSSTAPPGCHRSERNKRRRLERGCIRIFVFNGVGRGGVDSDDDGCSHSLTAFEERFRLFRGPPACARPARRRADLFKHDGLDERVRKIQKEERREGFHLHSSLFIDYRNAQKKNSTSTKKLLSQTTTAASPNPARNSSNSSSRSCTPSSPSGHGA